MHRGMIRVTRGHFCKTSRNIFAEEPSNNTPINTSNIIHIHKQKHAERISSLKIRHIEACRAWDPKTTPVLGGKIKSIIISRTLCRVKLGSSDKYTIEEIQISQEMMILLYGLP